MRARGGVPVVLLFLLLAASAAAVLFFVRREQSASSSAPGEFAFSDYGAFRVVRGKLPDASLEDALLRTADRELQAHGLVSRGEGLATAADEVAVVVEPLSSAPDRAVTVRLVTAGGADVWSIQLSAIDAPSLRDIAEANLAAMLKDPRFQRH